MMRLFRFECLKIFGFKSFWMFLIGYMTVVLLAVWSGEQMIRRFMADLPLRPLALLESPMIFHTLAYVSGYFDLFLALIVIYAVTNEYQYKTLRQHLIDGLSREKVVLGRGLLIILLKIISFAWLVGLGFVFAHSSEGETQTVLPIMELMVGFFLQGFGYLTLALLVATFVKRPIPAAAVFLAWSFMGEMVIGSLANWYSGFEVKAYLPLQTFSGLIPSPLKLFRESGSEAFLDHTFLLIAVGYLILFWLLTYLKTKFSDL